MTEKFDEQLQNLPAHPASDAGLMVQLNEVVKVARNIGLGLASEFIVDYKRRVCDLVEQARNQQAILFRLKQIDELLSSDHVHTQQKIALNYEKNQLFHGVSMPEGISISEFVAECEDHADLISKLADDIRTGRIHAS